MLLTSSEKFMILLGMHTMFQTITIFTIQLNKQI